MDVLAILISTDALALEKTIGIKRPVLVQKGLEAIEDDWRVDSDFERFYCRVRMNTKRGTTWNINNHEAKYGTGIADLSSQYGVPKTEVVRRALAAGLYLSGCTISTEETDGNDHQDGFDGKFAGRIRFPMLMNSVIVERYKEISERLSISEVFRYGLILLAEMGLSESADLLEAASRGASKILVCANKKDIELITATLAGSSAFGNKIFKSPARVIVRLAIITYLDYVQKRIPEFQYCDQTIPAHKDTLEKILLESYQGVRKK